METTRSIRQLSSGFTLSTVVTAMHSCATSPLPATTPHWGVTTHLFAHVTLHIGPSLFHLLNCIVVLLGRASLLLFMHEVDSLAGGGTRQGLL
ncbi:hypothetical protein V8C86DRAFT_2820935 [Haematococcus lacustris]